MKRLILTLVAFGAFAVLPASANAQVQFGGQASFASDTDFGVGARAVLDLESMLPGLEGIGAFDYFFPGVEGFSYFEINVNGAYMLPVEVENVDLYAGGGINIARFSFDSEGFGGIGGGFGSASTTQTGLNVLGGAKLPGGAITPFGEVRLELSGGEQLVISAGALFGGS